MAVSRDGKDTSGPLAGYVTLNNATNFDAISIDIVVPSDQKQAEFEIQLVFKDDHRVDPATVIKTIKVKIDEKAAAIDFDINSLKEKEVEVL